MSKFIKGFKDWFFGRQSEGAPFRPGGQAVMEGVMMQGSKLTAIAVRQQNGQIAVKTRATVKPGDKYPCLKWPLLRGITSFVMSLASGMKTLAESAEMAGEAPEEPSKFERKLAEILHMKPDDVMMAVAVVLAVVLAIGLFFALPVGIEALIKRYVQSNALVKIIGGVVRIGVFLTYIGLVSRLKEIRRVFQYHGAEHKSIYCYESGKELTVDNARAFTRLHPRCGTSFLVIVMVISIVVFLFLGNNSTNVFRRLGSNLLLLPLVAGISYEVLQGLARAEDRWWVRALKWPGLMVQKVTTAEPDDQMLEVALTSLKASMGMEWKAEAAQPIPAGGEATEPEVVHDGAAMAH
ncbi:DUF1385 domain-containing protein [Bacillota bacterium Meth-B3]